ncbi:MAG: YvcK family protein [Candidatus Eremiobacteraeota bacterium]|nr:YvcK family protein [Candidatus Eremiobacteraeota bacterium]
MKPLLRYFKWLYPGMGVKRWLILFSVGLIIFVLGTILIINIQIPVNIESAVVNSVRAITGTQIDSRVVDIALIILGLVLMVMGIKQWFVTIYREIAPHDERKLVDILYEKRHLAQGIKFVALGGGTGLSSLLRGIKEHTSNITAVVTVSDDGGSSGRLRKEMGVLAPGDIRNCLVALANDESQLSSLFQYRFTNGEGLEGHNFGNLLLVALNNIAGDFEKAVRLSSDILAIRGRVFPATLEPVVLCAEYEDGSIAEGESNIPKHRKKIKRIFFHPSSCKPPTDVIQAIKDADAIILGPGSLYTSIIPTLIVEGIRDAITASSAIKIYVCNIMTQPGETDHFTASDHVKNLLMTTGIPKPDYVIVNQEMPEKLIKTYQAEGAFPVLCDLEKIRAMDIIPVSAPLISEQESVVRHDPKKLAAQIIRIVLEVAPRQAEIAGRGPTPTFG